MFSNNRANLIFWAGMDHHRLSALLLDEIEYDDTDFFSTEIYFIKTETLRGQWLKAFFSYSNVNELSGKSTKTEKKPGGIPSITLRCSTILSDDIVTAVTCRRLSLRGDIL